MVCISSYAEAEAHWNKTKLWANTNKCPLSGRRETNKALSKLHDGSFECALYGTALVIYHPLGGVTLHTHNSLSSRMFMERVAPTGCCTRWTYGNTFWQISTDEGLQYRLNSIEMYPGANKTWRILRGGDQALETVKDKPLCAKIRRNLKMYASWYGVTSRLISIPHDHQPGALPYQRLSQIVDGPFEPEIFPEIAPYLGSPSNYSFYDRIYRVVGAIRHAPVPFNRLPRTAT